MRLLSWKTSLRLQRVSYYFNAKLIQYFIIKYSFFNFRTVGLIECPAVFECKGDRVFRVFGLSRIPEMVEGKTEMMRYWLYPRKLDNSTYFNHTIRIGDALSDLVLYFGDKFIDYGFRVTDLKCYERLVGLFKESTMTHLVPLEGIKTEVPLFGEVLVLDKNVQKKWLYGYGWGLGSSLGWGWGGLGYGYPYSAYYWGK